MAATLLSETPGGPRLRWAACPDPAPPLHNFDEDQQILNEGDQGASVHCAE
jgi:hypothetical protein